MEYNYLVGLSFTIWVTGFLLLALKKDKRLVYLSIFISAFLIRIFVAQQDDFLHSWDERYHALVAKNLVHHPFAPTLKDRPLLSYDKFDWRENHIWLHKQPGFLYPMSISIAVFGNNEFGVRFPSIVMGALIALLIFKIGTRCFNINTAYLASGLFVFSFFQLEQTAGVIGMDHNDIAFSFYFVLSVWAYVEYRLSNKVRYIYLIALFTGLSTLTKWLPGLAIYGVWMLDIFIFRGINRFYDFKRLLESFFSSMILWGGWQLYILLRWPDETRFEYQFNRRHFSEPLEGHGGNWDYHFLLFDQQYGKYAIIFLIIGLAYFVLRRQEGRFKSIFLFIPATTYIVFSFAATKSHAYVFYISPLIFLVIAYGVVLCLEVIMAEIKNQKYAYASIIVISTLLCTIQFSSHKLYQTHVLGISAYVNNYREVMEHNASIYKKLDSAAADCDIIFNCRYMQDIDAEFYSSKIVYGGCPDSMVLDSLSKKGYRIGAFEGFNNQPLPDYVISDPKIKIIPLEQMNEEK